MDKEKCGIVDDLINNMKRELNNLIDTPDKLIEFINKNLKPKNEEKKKYGEVFTPLELINEMLDKLPSSVWTNPNLKWFEPASGMGNFTICVYLRLLNTLKKIFKTEQATKKHILKNMLYMSELNPKNVLICKQIFGVDYLNLHEGNTLELDPKKEWGIKTFDIIMGNPPFQEKDKTGDNKLYLSFTEKSIHMLKKDGYLLFITPPNTLNYLLLVSKNRKYINVFYQLKYIAYETINEFFKTIGSSFCYFLLQKSPQFEETIIEYVSNKSIKILKTMLSLGVKIPKSLSEVDLDILNKITCTHNNYEFRDFKFSSGNTRRIRKDQKENGTVTSKKTQTHNIKIIDTINISNPFPPKEYYYYTEKDTSFDKDKLVLSKKGYLMPTLDNTHSYTYSDNFKYILDDNLQKLQILFKSKLIDYLIFQYSTSGFGAIDAIRYLCKKDIKNIKNEDDIYKVYNLNVKEIEHMFKITKPKL